MNVLNNYFEFIRVQVKFDHSLGSIGSLSRPGYSLQGTLHKAYSIRTKGCERVVKQSSTKIENTGFYKKIAFNNDFHFSKIFVTI